VDPHARLRLPRDGTAVSPVLGSSRRRGDENPTTAGNIYCEGGDGMKIHLMPPKLKLKLKFTL
jgi:hypothetical protein